MASHSHRWVPILKASLVADAPRSLVASAALLPLTMEALLVAGALLQLHMAWLLHIGPWKRANGFGDSDSKGRSGRV